MLASDALLNDIAAQHFGGDMATVERIANRYYGSAFKRNTGYVGAVL